MKRRGRPPRAIAQIRAVVEFMETPQASKSAAAKRFHTIERNIDDILKDHRARAWAATLPTIRLLILDLERCQAEGVKRFSETGIFTRWRHPKLDFIEKTLSPEELDRRGNESVTDVYELALGRHELRRRETRRARKVNENK